MTGERRRGMALVFGGLLVLMVVPASLTAWLVWQAMPTDAKTQIAALISPHLGLVFLVLAFALLPLAALARVLWHAGPGRYLQLSEAVRLAAAHGGNGRIDTEDDSETRTIANAVNSLLDKLAAGENAIAERIARASGAVTSERNVLATLMADLPVGVIACNSEGAILLYNKRARIQVKALQHVAHTLDQDALIGLGRSIFNVFERDEIIDRLAQPNGAPRAYLTPKLASVVEGTSLRAHVSPIRGQTGSPEAVSGFLLIMEHDRSVLDKESEEPELSPNDSRPEYYDFDLFAARDLTVDLDQPLSRLAFTAFDTETTGLEPSAGDEIIQIGAIRIVNGRLLRTETFDRLIDPQRRLTQENIAVHGITNEQLQGQPTLANVLPAFHAYCADTVLVAHNAAFDMRFFQMKEDALGLRFGHPVLDTLILSDLVAPNQESHRLEEIARRLGVAVQGRHTASGDAIVTAQVFLAMLPLLAAQGLITLRQVLDASRKSRFARLDY